MSDGNLRQIFRKHLPHFDWQSVETWSTGRGVPDLNYCCCGSEGWIEGKVTKTHRAVIGPEQVGWIERRVRHGGRVFLAVRRLNPIATVRKVAADELWLIHGQHIRQVKDEGFPTGHRDEWVYENGPAKWDWKDIEMRLKK
jgi:hypothetical protein